IYSRWKRSPICDPILNRTSPGLNSTRTSKILTAMNTEAQSTLFQEAIPASQAQSLGWEKAKQMSVSSGLKSIELYGKYSHLQSLTRMLTEQLPTASLTGRLMIWKVKGTP